MKSALFRTICRMLVASLLFMNVLPVQAGMIGADQLTGSTAGADRAAVLDAIARPDVSSQLQAQGVDPRLATERVAALSDQEVQALRGEIDSLPAGARSNSGWWIAGVIILAVVIWYYWK